MPSSKTVAPQKKNKKFLNISKTKQLPSNAAAAAAAAAAAVWVMTLGQHVTILDVLSIHRCIHLFLKRNFTISAVKKCEKCVWIHVEEKKKNLIKRSFFGYHCRTPESDMLDSSTAACQLELCLDYTAVKSILYYIYLTSKLHTKSLGFCQLQRLKQKPS